MILGPVVNGELNVESDWRSLWFYTVEFLIYTVDELRRLRPTNQRRHFVVDNVARRIQGLGLL